MMNGIIQIANTLFDPMIQLGAAPMMFILLSLMAILMGVKVSKAIEGGLKLGIAITGVGAVINILTGSFAPALQDFVRATGIELTITDVGWAPLATITWGSVYTLFFLLVLIVVNLILLVTNQTDTLDVDIFNSWHLSFTGLLVLYYADNLLLATVFVVFLGVLKFINADVMKPTFNDLLDMPEENPTTTTHLNFLINPLIMAIDQIINRLFPHLDSYDFDAAKLNDKIGFWGSRFAIGAYLGVFVGILGDYSLNATLNLAFISATSLELFAVIGQWFIAAMEPISQGITNFLSNRLQGRSFNIGIDWPFLAARPEMWTVANILAPILVLVALLLPGNKVLPLGGIILTSLTPALLVISRGKILRMLITGGLMLPLFLWSGTAIAPFVTNVAESVGAIPPELADNVLISHSTLGSPLEKFLAILIGQAGNKLDWRSILIAVGALIVYLALFAWYVKQMKKRNAVYAKEKKAGN